jgi:uncharacterized protein DUF6152
MKRKLEAAVLGACLVLFTVAPALAHHTFVGTYFPGKTITIEGEVVQFLYRNPHSFIHVKVTDPETGAEVRYGVEWAAGGQLDRSGVSRETLKPGDHVVIVGYPARKADDHMLRMVTITRPSDGWKWGLAFD